MVVIHRPARRFVVPVDDMSGVVLAFPKSGRTTAAPMIMDRLRPATPNDRDRIPVVHNPPVLEVSLVLVVEQVVIERMDVAVAILRVAHPPMPFAARRKERVVRCGHASEGKHDQQYPHHNDDLLSPLHPAAPVPFAR